ncbi:putative threonine efflux protein [Solimicrobium silvestre]|uniref:Putative threonine efflux protein n=2 Tax=Solimicrobium silvestre TaxID=2099400 RepID=A0A2S9GV85_9BURK|nr:putative threonine efflux protein [Solimicrobium silvestre]
MAFVMAHGVSYGLRGGAAASFGIGVADLVLTALTATGITAMVAAWPPAFDLIRYAGAVYLLWMAYKALQHPRGSVESVAAQTSLQSIFVRSMINSLLNPKALLFFMVFLPQFVDQSKGSVALQLIVLGCVLTVISTVFHTLLGTFGSSIRLFLSRHSYAARLQPYGLATVLLLLAFRLAFMRRP